MPSVVIVGTIRDPVGAVKSLGPLSRATGLGVRVENRISFQGNRPRYEGGVKNMGQRGPKPGSGGRPKKPIADKIADGNPGKRPLTVIDFKDSAADLEGQPMPKPSEFLSAKQKDRSVLPRFMKMYGNGCPTVDAPPSFLRSSLNASLWQAPDGFSVSPSPVSWAFWQSTPPRVQQSSHPMWLSQTHT